MKNYFVLGSFPTSYDLVKLAVGTAGSRKLSMRTAVSCPLTIAPSTCYYGKRTLWILWIWWIIEKRKE